MGRPHACESRDFIKGCYCYSFYKRGSNDYKYSELLDRKILKYRDLVWIELNVPGIGEISGMVMRNKLKNIRRRNLEYEFNGKFYKINDIIKDVYYETEFIKWMVVRNVISYDIIFNFEIFVPKMYCQGYPYKDTPEIKEKMFHQLI